MITYVTTQSISDERLKLYAEHAKLCDASIHDRESNEKRQAIWARLVKSPTVVEATSSFDEETNTQTTHLEWRE